MPRSLLYWSSRLTLLGLAMTVGCNKPAAETAPPGVAPAATTGDRATPASAMIPPGPAVAVVGRWKISTLKGVPDSQHGIFDDLRSETLNLRADHSYRRFNTAVGGTSGTWALAGNALTLTPDAQPGGLHPQPKSLQIDGANLLDKGADSYTPVYAKLSTDADVPKFTITPDQLLTGPKGGDPKYNNQVVELDGTVSDLMTTLGDEPYFRLSGPARDGPSSKGMLPGVICLTVDQNIAGKYAPGQSIKVRGTAQTSSYGDPRLVECEVVSAGPSTQIVFDTAALAAEYARDRSETDKKYGGDFMAGKPDKGVVITGPFLSKKDAGMGGAVVLGTKDAAVTCFLFGTDGQKAKLAALKPGDAVALYGHYSTIRDDDKAGAVIRDCQFVTPAGGQK